MNLRVRRVTAESAMFARLSPEVCLRSFVVTDVGLCIVDGGRSRCRGGSARKFVLVTRNQSTLSLYYLSIHYGKCATSPSVTGLSNPILA